MTRSVIDTYTWTVEHADVSEDQAEAVAELLNAVVGPDGRFVTVDAS